MNNKPIIIITGTDEFIGSNLLSYFSRLGFDVRAFQRKQEQLNDPHVCYYQFTLESIEDRGFAGANYLIHCAYEPKGANKNTGADVNIDGTRNLLSLCRKYNIKPILISTLLAHPEAKSEYGRSKLEMEGLFDISRDLILKPGFILGAGGLLAKISSAIERYKIIPLVGGGEQYIQTIALEDLARIIESGIEKNISGSFVITHPIPIKMRELFSEIAKVVSAHPFFVPLSIPIAFQILHVAETIGLHLTISSENVLDISRLKFFETESALKIFGVTTKNARETLSSLPLSSL